MSKKQEADNPIAASLKIAKEHKLNAIRDSVNKKVTEVIKELKPKLREMFPEAYAEFRTPTEEEIQRLIEERSGDEPTEFSNDNDGQDWYVRNRLVPLFDIMANAKTELERVKLLRNYLFEERYVKELPVEDADEYLASL